MDKALLELCGCSESPGQESGELGASIFSSKAENEVLGEVDVWPSAGLEWSLQEPPEG